MRRSAPAGGLSIQRLGETCVALQVLLVPLIVVPGAKDAFRLPKLLLAEGLALASLALLAWSGGELLWRRVAASRALRIVAPMLAVATVGGFFALHPARTWPALGSLWVGTLCLLVWSVAIPAERLRRLLVLTVVPAALLSVLAVLQATGLFQPFDFQETAEQARASVTSLAGNTGDLAMVLVLPILVAQFGLAGRPRSSWRWLLLALLLAALSFTAAFVPLAAVVVGSSVLWGQVSWRKLAAMAGSLAFVLALAVGLTPVGERLIKKSEQAGHGAIDAVLSGRPDGWRAALWMVGERPLAGVGHGAYRAEFGRAKLSGLAAGEHYYRGHVFFFFVNAHCEPLEVAAEWGWPGVGALLWALALVLVHLRHRAPPRSLDAALAWGGLTGLVVLSLANFPWRVAIVAYPAVLWLAWCLVPVEEPA